MNSIRWRLFALALLIILPLSGLVFYQVSDQRAKARQDAQQTSLRLVRIAINQQDEIINKAKALLVTLTTLPQMQPDQNGVDCSLFLGSIFKEFSGYTNIGAATPEGNIYCSAQPLTGAVNIKDRKYFIDALRQQDFSVGEYQIGRVTGKPGVNFGYPIYRGPDVVAVAFVAVDLQALSDLAIAVSLGPNSTLSVFDRQGTYLVRHPNPDQWVGRRLPQAEITALVLGQQREGTGEARGVDGIKRLYGYGPLVENNPSVFVAVGIPTSVAYAKADRNLRDSLIVLAMVAVVSLGLAWYIGERIIIRTAEASSRLAAIVASSDDAIYTKSPKGIILTWNRGAEKMYGYTAADMIGQFIGRIVDAQHRPELDMILSSIRQGKKFEHFETVRVTKSGRQIEVSLTITPLRDRRGKIYASAVIARDITEKKRIERMKSDFVSLVSHQLKTPSGIINGYVDNMLLGLTGAITDRQKEYLERMREVSTKNYQLISDLLNVSRIERGVIEVNIQPVSLRACIDQAVKEYQPLYHNKGLYLNVAHGAGNTTVLADEQKFVECIKNTLNNAMKFTAHGGVTVSIQSHDRRATVEVTDTGKGMDEAGMGKLFTRDRVLSGSASPEGSSGLGLYIAKEFMKLQGGDITATSQLGRGSTFTFTVPLA